MKLSKTIRTDLLDSDGENKAVRAFLSMYNNDRSITVGSMAKSMEAMGWNDHPDWVDIYSKSFLTKAGTQLWIRHLFSLEPQSKNANMFWVEGGDGTGIARSISEAIDDYVNVNGYEPSEGDLLVVQRASRLTDIVVRIVFDRENDLVDYELV